jgi:hypothetical protein
MATELHCPSLLGPEISRPLQLPLSLGKLLFPTPPTGNLGLVSPFP